MSRGRRITVGDIFDIPLTDGRRALGQYVFSDEKYGPLIQVYDLITEEPINIVQLKAASPLFPPVITGLFAAIRNGIWNVVGHLPIADFGYPCFVSAHYDQRTGRVHYWYLWDGKRPRPIGPRLPEKHKQLEYLVVWSPHDVVHRIETGEYPYPYGDLKTKNEFTPMGAEETT